MAKKPVSKKGSKSKATHSADGGAGKPSPGAGAKQPEASAQEPVRKGSRRQKSTTPGSSLPSVESAASGEALGSEPPAGTEGKKKPKAQKPQADKSQTKKRPGEKKKKPQGKKPASEKKPKAEKLTREKKSQTKKPLVETPQGQPESKQAKGVKPGRRAKSSKVTSETDPARETTEAELNEVSKDDQPHTEKASTAVTGGPEKSASKKAGGRPSATTKKKATASKKASKKNATAKRRATSATATDAPAGPESSSGDETGEATSAQAAGSTTPKAGGRARRAKAASHQVVSLDDVRRRVSERQREDEGPAVGDDPADPAAAAGAAAETTARPRRARGKRTSAVTDETKPAADESDQREHASASAAGDVAGSATGPKSDARSDTSIGRGDADENDDSDEADDSDEDDGSDDRASVEQLLGREDVDDESEEELSEEEETRRYLKGLVEALLFSSDKPLTVRELARAAKLDRKRTAELLEDLKRDYRHGGIKLYEIGGGLSLRSSPTYADYVQRMLAMRPVRLSRAQLETLAIIAYRQPVTRPEIDDIRGVDSGQVIKGLLDRELIKILGKKDEAGRPMLYGTAPAFLELFSLESLKDLPSLREFAELSDESRESFQKSTGEDAPRGQVLEDLDEAAAAAGEAVDETASETPTDDSRLSSDAVVAEVNLTDDERSVDVTGAESEAPEISEPLPDFDDPGADALSGSGDDGLDDDVIHEALADDVDGERSRSGPSPVEDPDADDPQDDLVGADDADPDDDLGTDDLDTGDEISGQNSPGDDLDADADDEDDLHAGDEEEDLDADAEEEDFDADDEEGELDADHAVDADTDPGEADAADSTDADVDSTDAEDGTDADGTDDDAGGTIDADADADGAEADADGTDGTDTDADDDDADDFVADADGTDDADADGTDDADADGTDDADADGTDDADAADADDGMDADDDDTDADDDDADDVDADGTGDADNADGTEDDADDTLADEELR